MAAGTNTILPGYTMQLGDKNFLHFDHNGPSSYVQLVAGSSTVLPTGGDKINALDLGMGGFDNFDTMVDPTGTYFALVIPVGGGSGNAVTSVILVWFVVATGAQVGAGVNLSTYAIRCEAVAV